MRSELIVVGKTADKLFEAAIKDYIGRIKHYIDIDFITIPAIKNSRSLSEEEQKTREGELILKHITSSDTVVLLDEHGKEMRSVELAQWLQHKMITARNLVFIIGGPYGFSPSVYARADEKLSLSRLTFSHQMVRLIFTEQLYRVCTILKGERYHHE